MTRTALFAVASLTVTPPLFALPVIGRTVPVGIVKLGDTTVGEPSVQSSTDVHLSIPFLKPATVKRTVQSVTGFVVTLASGPSAEVPPGTHYMVIESGSKAGLIALVDSSTSNSVTVSLQPGDDLTGITTGDDITLRPAWTLSTLFAGSIPNSTQLFVYSGSHTGMDIAPELIFSIYQNSWYDSNDDSDANNFVLFPNETFILRSEPSGEIPFLGIWGEASTNPSRCHTVNSTATATDNPISYLGSTDEPITSSGLAAASLNFDELGVYDNGQAGYDKAPLTVLYRYAGSFFDSSNDEEVGVEFKLEAGKGYRLRRMTTSIVAPTLWSDMPDYLPLD